MEKQELLESLKLAMEDLDTAAVVRLSKEVLMAGIDTVEAIQYSLLGGMKTLSSSFDEGNIFVPHLLVAADAFEQAVAILTKRMSRRERALTSQGKILVYTVEGDIHDIGKNIIKTVLQANNFELRDLGRNVSAEQVVEEAKRWQADLIIGFALMTTTLPVQQEIINVLNEQKVRQNYKVLVGGVLASAEWAEKIGADGYADGVAEVVEAAKTLVCQKKRMTA